MRDRASLPGVRLLPLVLLALLGVAGGGSAHAVYESSIPPANGHAPADLEYVEVRFSEDVLPDYTSIDIIDQQGQSIATGPVQFDEDAPNVVRRPIGMLGDGVYAVNWRALSIDTHTTRGSFLFSAGSARLVFTTAPTSDPTAHPTAAIVKDGAARAGFFVGLFAAIGMPLFALVVDRERPAPRHLLLGAGSLALVGALAAGVMLLLFAGRTQLDVRSALATAAGTSIGWRGLLLALAGAALVAGAFAPGRAKRNLAALAVLIAGAALAAQALGSHAAAIQEQRALSVGMDAAHLLMGAVWVGGVGAFLLVAWGRPMPEVGRLVTRFTPLAITSVGILIATGTYASLQHIPAVSDLWEERYGRLVALKILLLVPLIALGWYNKERAGPALLAGDARPGAFRRALQVEAVVMVLILTAAGMLAASPPPERQLDGGAPPPAFFELTGQTRTTHVILQVAPNPVTVGLQNVTVILHSLNGPLPNTTEVALKFQSPDETREPETLVTPDIVGPGEWSTGEDGIFTSPGTWKVHVLLQRPDEYREIVFEVPVSAAGIQNVDEETPP